MNGVSSSLVGNGKNLLLVEIGLTDGVAGKQNGFISQFNEH